jgi:hypothetical protein
LNSKDKKNREDKRKRRGKKRRDKKKKERGCNSMKQHWLLIIPSSNSSSNLSKRALDVTSVANSYIAPPVTVGMHLTSTVYVIIRARQW